MTDPKEGTYQQPECSADDGAQPPTAPTSIHSLDATYLYQNRRTGSASAAPLTVRQLCRLLCPPSAAAAANPLVAEDTPVIGYDPATGQYSALGWVQARDVPVLREAGSSWYYEASDVEERKADGSKGVKGPITTRDLAGLHRGGGGGGEEKGGSIDHSTRVWSSDFLQREQQREQNWQYISDLPLLRLAMEAFEDVNQQLSALVGQNKRSQPPLKASDHGSNGLFRDSDAVSQTNGTKPQPDGQSFDEADMVFDDGDDGVNAPIGDPELSKQEEDDLEAFLNTTAEEGDNQSARNGKGTGEGSDNEEEYESDGGTRYIKDPLSGGTWVHEDLASGRRTKQAIPLDLPINKTNGIKRPSDRNQNDGKSYNRDPSAGAGRKRKKKGKFTAKNARLWVYVTGLPSDTDEDEVVRFCSKVGVLDLDPETQQSKVKLYRRREGDASGPVGSVKGDASICFARPESVDLAMQILDGSFFRSDCKDKVSVERAKFEQHGSKFVDRGKISNSKRKVAKLAALQAIGWDEGENGRITGGRKGLCIVVLKAMFDLIELEKEGEDAVLKELEEEIRAECEKWGIVEKITVFAKNPEGVVVVKFTKTAAASTAVSEYQGRMRKGRKIAASFWDGVTDFTVKDVEKEEKEESERMDTFGEWLEAQKLPEHLRLQVDE